MGSLSLSLADLSGVGADNIAKHYKYTLSSIFSGPSASDFAILVEDDMVSMLVMGSLHS